MDTETFLLGWGEMQVKKKKIGQNWGIGRSVYPLEGQPNQSRDAAISLLKKLSLFKIEKEDAKEATPHNGEMSLDNTTAL